MTPPIKRPKYSEEAMNRALADVALGVPKATAAKRHGVNRVTLLNKVNGKHRAEQRMGPDAVLSKEEENILVLWIQSMSRVGYPVTRSDLLDSVQQLVKRLRRPNTFTDGRPGKKWYHGFIHRNPSVNNRMAENLTISRARVTTESLQKWYNHIYEYLDSNGFLNALRDPRRVFNCDESAFFLNPKGNRVLAVKGDKNVYQVVNSDEKECLTVLVTASAQGKQCPPLIVFKYKRIPQEIVFSVPPEWGIGRSDSGWMTSAVFYEFLANIFHPWLLKNNTEFPVILFIDGHSSHVTLEASEFCDKNQIVLITLHPNATHLIQPLDVSLFKALKSIWKKKVHQWRMKNTDNPCLRKRDFAPLLNEALSEVSEETVINGFRASGLVPWNPQEGFKTLKGLESVIPKEKLEQTAHSKNAKRNQDALRVFEDNIPKSKLLLFKQQGEEYDGSPEDASLFALWKTIRSKCADEERCPGIIPSVDGEVADVNDVDTNTDIINIPNGDNNIDCAGANTSNDDVLKAIPSPFKKALIWTPVIQHAKKNLRISNKGIGPGAVSSIEWRNAIMAKEKKRLQDEETKRKRAQERIQKKKEKEESQKKKKEEKLRKQQLKKATVLKEKPLLRKRATLKCNRVPESSTEEEEEWQPSNSESDELTSDEPTVDGPNLHSAEPRPSTSGLQTKLDNTLIKQLEPILQKRPEEGQPGQPEVNPPEQLEEDLRGPSKENQPDHVEEKQRAPSEGSQSVVVVQEQKKDAIATSVVVSSPLEDEVLNDGNEANEPMKLKPNKEATFFIGSRSTSRNKNSKTLFKIKELLPAEEAIVVPLNPCNRWRMVFVESKQHVDILDLSKIEVTYVPHPVKFGKKEDKKYHFPAPLQVDW